jgi:hypothetical protein
MYAWPRPHRESDQIRPDQIVMGLLTRASSRLARIFRLYIW